MQFNKQLWWKLSIAGVLLGVLGLIVWFGPADTAGKTTQGTWTCSMHPQVRQAAPGSCPLCGMDLVPVEQLGKDSRQAGVETEAVQYRELFKEIRTVGKIDYHEARVADITARIAGRVDRLYADFTGISVKKEDHLVDIYSPDLFVAQEELIRQAEKKGSSSTRVADDLRLLEAARTKLHLWGMLPAQIQEIEKTRKVQTHLTIYAPIGGTVIEKMIREGQYVKEGDMLYRIADFDVLWLYLDIYEFDLSWVRYGQPVTVRVEAFPGEKFDGMVTFINPFLDDKTRTVKARVNLKNTEKKLKPAMYATATIRVRLMADGTPEPTGLEGKYVSPMHPEVIRDEPGRCPICGMALERVPGKPRQAAPPPDKQDAHAKHQMSAPAGKVLAIPTAAVLDTGRRKVAFRLTKEGAFDMIDLEVGPRAESKDETGLQRSYYPVLAGLQAGDRVVVRGGFLLDSQRQIEGMPSVLFPQGQSGAALHAGHGGHAPAPPPGHKH